jgi:hypothetical protein
MYFQKNNVGSVKQHSCSECIFVKEQLIKKRKDFNLPTYMSINYEKVFDRVPHGKLWNIIKNKGFPDHIVKTVQILYINARMKTDKETSTGNQELHITQGVIRDVPQIIECIY